MRYCLIKRNTYQDSLRLMHLSRKLEVVDGVNQVSIMMGTPANKEILRSAGLATPELDDAQLNDLVIAADVSDVSVGESLVTHVDAFLSARASAGRAGLRTARSLERAIEIGGGVDLALVSVPGEYAAPLVTRLLDRDVHVFVFSDNVSVEDEVALKSRARQRGLLVMGPDCGTASIGGLPLGFTNVVHAGSIGLVGASGTGLQEVMVQIDRFGGGVSHAIGLGGRDLSAEVGGITCLQALQALDADAATDVIVLVSKPPAPSVRDEILAVLQRLSKPAVAILLGERIGREVDGNIHFAGTLEETARTAVELAGTRMQRPVRLDPQQRCIKGLFTGGTLASEAAGLLSGPLGVPIDRDHPKGYLINAGGHEVVDLGDDAYTQGRPHPMIDPSVRTERLGAVFDDPRSAVLLLDLVLGYGSHPDPAGALASVIAAGLARLNAMNRDLAVVASVCGTEEDPQSLRAQTSILEQAGVTVLPSNAAAVRHALAIVRGSQIGDRSPAASPDRVGRLLSQAPKIINIGLAEFAENLVKRGAQVVHYDWSPVAGGDRRMQALIDALG